LMLNSGVFSSEEVLQAIKLVIAKKAMHIFFILVSFLRI
jgi:hypothetical protein